MAETAKNQWIDGVLGRLSLEQLVGQLLVPYVTGATVDTAAPENRERFGVDTPAEVIKTLQPGGVIYFAWSGNVDRPEQTAELSAGLQRIALDDHGPQIGLMIATDQENGIVVRLKEPVTQFPGAMALGAIAGDAGRSRDCYRITGRELRAVGINADYAPDGDVNVNPANPVIGVRSFGSDPDRVSEHVVASIHGLQQDAGISASVKHFPGHGDSAVDSHSDLPVITHDRATWERVDAPPFRAAIAAGVDLVMSAHLSFPAFDPSGDPATLSRPVITGLLRDELGYQGVITTDALDMQGVRTRYPDGEVAVRAIEAGIDHLLDPPQPLVARDALLQAVREGRLSEERIAASVRRILSVKWDRGYATGPDPDRPELSIIGSDEHRAVATSIAREAITIVRDDASLIPLAAGSVLVTGWGDAAVPRLAAGLRSASESGIVRVEELITGPEPSAGTIGAAVALAVAVDRVVLVTSSAWRNPPQQALAAALVAANPRLVVVSARDPYDLSVLPATGTLITGYSALPATLDAVTEVLLGRDAAPGHLPVEL
ncbi:glycoside hydrolase family 3 protein [Microlunatus speluncae]|uniref:glycoside hydrolase family 3 protein n=1 Tax=Microlunatus speluncae TaxID=2594267 RepID=UPI001266789A|nr:glycoside hydrolase family 3 protein [Microlunatus speluncae]